MRDWGIESSSNWPKVILNVSLSGVTTLLLGVKDQLRDLYNGLMLIPIISLPNGKSGIRKRGREEHLMSLPGEMI